MNADSEEAQVFSQLKHLKNIITFRELMTETHVNVVYMGNVTQYIVEGVCEMISEDLNVRNENKRVVKRVYFVMLEAIQNICRHADSRSKHASNSIEKGLVKDGVFLIGHNDQEYFVSTGNQISTENAFRLRNTLDYINSLDEQGIKDLYRSTMQETEISEQGGAGLGFIDIAKKTGTKFEYYFEPDSETTCFFVLTIRVAKV